MSRRGGTREEIYEERGGYYGDPPLPGGQQRVERVERVERVRAPPVRARDLEDIEYTRVDRDRQPEFLRREYAPVEQQPLVLRAREVETFTRPVRRERSPSIERVRTRERVVERERSPSPAPVERVTTRTRMVERERSPSPASVERVTTRTRMVERERSPSPERERISRTRVDVRERSGSLDTNRGGERYSSTRVVERDTRERYREPSVERVRTTTRTVERERERSPSPLPDRETIRTRVVERERRRSPSIESSPSPPPEPPIIRAPPIHQEIITHHRHIDHGKYFESFLLYIVVANTTEPQATITHLLQPLLPLPLALVLLSAREFANEKPKSTSIPAKTTPRSISTAATAAQVDDRDPAAVNAALLTTTMC